MAIPPSEPIVSRAPIVWDIEREGSVCGRCSGAIGAGEAFRRSTRVVDRKFCESCSFAIDGLSAPSDIHALDFVGRLRADTSMVRRSRTVGEEG